MLLLHETFPYHYWVTKDTNTYKSNIIFITTTFIIFARLFTHLPVPVFQDMTIFFSSPTFLLPFTAYLRICFGNLSLFTLFVSSLIKRSLYQRSHSFSFLPSVFISSLSVCTFSSSRTSLISLFYYSFFPFFVSPICGLPLNNCFHFLKFCFPSLVLLHYLARSSSFSDNTLLFPLISLRTDPLLPQLSFRTLRCFLHLFT